VPLLQTLVEGLDGEIVATTTEPVPMLVNHRPEETAIPPPVAQHGDFVASVTATIDSQRFSTPTR
jgi:hypothetical protein